MPTDPTNAGEAGEGFKIPPPTPEQEKEFKQYFMGEFSAAPTNEELIAEAQTHDLSLAKVRLMADRLEAAGKRAEEAALWGRDCESVVIGIMNWFNGRFPHIGPHGDGWCFRYQDEDKCTVCESIEGPFPILTDEARDILRAAKVNTK